MRTLEQHTGFYSNCESEDYDDQNANPSTLLRTRMSFRNDVRRRVRENFKVDCVVLQNYIFFIRLASNIAVKS